MKLTFLGTCAGTEPMPGRHHVSFVVQLGGRLYWFDAGESCSYTAHLLGIDLRATEAIFITHAHMDHVGGLPNLLWTIRKLETLVTSPEDSIEGKDIRVFIPNMESWNGIHKLLLGTEGGFETNFSITAQDYDDGPVFRDDALEVNAVSNNHLPPESNNGKRLSFSLRIDSDSRRIVYSGDIADVSELEPLLTRVDLLLIETGHHRVEDICEYLRPFDEQIAKVGFIHHGRAILKDPEGEIAKARAILGDKAFLTHDGMTFDFGNGA